MTSNIPTFIQHAIALSSTRIASGFDRVFLYEFDFLEAHREFAESHFMQNANSFKEKFQLEISALDGQDKEDYAEFMADEYARVVEILPRLQWNAQYLVVYSAFEHALNELCAIVKRRSKLSLSIRDLEGQGIRRAANYLKKVAGVKTPFQTAEWNNAILLADIRNVIAHRNGEIDFRPEDKSSIYYRAKKITSIEITRAENGDQYVDIILSAEFVRGSIKCLRKILTDIANYELYKVDSQTKKP